MKWVSNAILLLFNLCILLSLRTNSSISISSLLELQNIGGGLVSYFILYKLVLKKQPNYKLVSTLSHELIHTFFSILLNNQVYEVLATDGKGGHIKYVGKSSNSTLISLSPYCLPIGFIALLLGYSFVAVDYLYMYEIFLGFILGFYLITFLEQTKFYQSDIIKHGKNFSLTFILLVNLLVLTTSFVVLLDGWGALPPMLLNGASLSFDFTKKLLLSI